MYFFKPGSWPQSTFQIWQVEQTCKCNKQTPKNGQSCDGPIEELHEPLPCCRSAVLIGLLFFLETRSKLYEPFQQNLRRPPLGQDCGRNFLVDDEFLIQIIKYPAFNRGQQMTLGHDLRHAKNPTQVAQQFGDLLHYVSSPVLDTQCRKHEGRARKLLTDELQQLSGITCA